MYGEMVIDNIISIYNYNVYVFCYDVSAPETSVTTGRVCPDNPSLSEL